MGAIPRAIRNLEDLFELPEGELVELRGRYLASTDLRSSGEPASAWVVLEGGARVLLASYSAAESRRAGVARSHLAGRQVRVVGELRTGPRGPQLIRATLGSLPPERPPSTPLWSSRPPAAILTGASRAALFEALCEHSPDAMIVTQEGNIVFASRGCRSLLGYEPDELIGQSVEILVPARFSGHVAMRRGYEADPVARPMGKRPISSARHKSGATIPVDISLSPLPTELRLTQVVLRDATPRWNVQQELLIQSVAMDSAANGIVITDTQGIIQWVNPAVTRMTGYHADELVGQHTRMLKSDEHDPGFYADLWGTILRGDTWYGQIANLRKDGSIYYEEQHISPVRDEDGELTHFIAIKQDVTERKLAEQKLHDAHLELTQRLDQIEALHQKLQEQAIRDPLTGLFNRRYLEETLAREIARSRREETPLAIVAIDIDYFKAVNDTLGHAAGDEVLLMLADRLVKSTRESDVPCRLGGDEFLVLMPGAPLTVAQRRASGWREQFARGQGDAATKCTLSLGVTMLRDDDAGAQTLLKRADDALYQAKREGRDRAITAS